ncbi:MAG TPA: hypothetical protein VNZ49_06735 [Bacteroidia bacterium]|jgi:hypothetical protein|nr:hypothetical protein [Bacteroidia bacterium]
MNSKKEYCCERFKGYYEKPELPRLIFPFFKIFKPASNKWDEEKISLRYSVVCGFEKDNPPEILIRYCPFCSKDLFKHYKDEEWVNGTETKI